MRQVVILICGLVLWCVSASAQLTEQQQIQKLNLVYQHIRNKYVDDVPLGPLVEEAIRATLKELDPHSTYLTKEQMEAMHSRMTGQFAGVGMSFMSYRDTIIVRGVRSDSPAKRGGLRLNDRIISVDGRNVIGIQADSVKSLLRGEEHTKLTLGVCRRGEPNPLTITLTRNIIYSGSIYASYCIGDIGYIAASSFSQPLAIDFMREYYGLGDVKGLVIDLRDNGGGVIGAAIELSSIFLEMNDVIVSTEGRENSQVYRNKKSDYSIDIPIVVLINESSASASEIFAGAIQDHDRGVIVGRTSFGKGLVQRNITFGDGSGMNITIARYKTPSGRLIQRPYTMGGVDEYRRDTMRYMHPDSISHDPQLMFTTLKRGRTVYGGGGITPDIYVAADTITYSHKFKSLINDNLINCFYVELWDRISVEEMMECYPTFESLLSEFEIDERIATIFNEATEYNYSEFDETEKRHIRTLIMAEVANQLYGKNAWYYVLQIENDHTLMRAVELLGSPEEYERVLSSDK